MLGVMEKDGIDWRRIRFHFLNCLKYAEREWSLMECIPFHPTHLFFPHFNLSFGMELWNWSFSSFH